MIDELEHIHRFSHEWEAAASLRLRQGDLRALDMYETHGRIIPGTFAEHLETIPDVWMQCHAAGETVAITAATNEHVDEINQTIRQRRARSGDTDTTAIGSIADGVVAVGDVVATRRNHRQLHTTSGDIVRNRELWTVTAIGPTGDLTVTDLTGTRTVTLPAEYALDHVRLGYAATEYGTQSSTDTASITLATPATTGRGLYVAMTRGRDDNHVYVVTDTHEMAEARDILEGIVACDRADIPAVAQRRQLAQQDRQPPRLQPRCQVPDWFHDLRADALIDYREARDALDDSMATRAPRHLARLGHRQPHDQQHLTDAVSSLHEVALHQPDNGTRQLADVIHQWADQRGIQLSRPPVEHRRSRAIEIDL